MIEKLKEKMGVFIVKLKKKKNYSNIDFCSLEGGRRTVRERMKKIMDKKNFLQPIK